jgi:hypothetical protein
MTSPWAALLKPQPTPDLWTPDEIDSWLASRKVRSRTEYHGGIGAVKVSETGGPSVVFQLPVARGVLAWTFLGEP